MIRRQRNRTSIANGFQDPAEDAATWYPKPMAITGYYLGCPFWGLKDWVGNLYRKGSRPGEFLAQYADVFNSVEGNTSFYGVPSEASVERWKEATSESFRFCFKMPQEVTHRKGLRGVERDVTQFLHRMAPLESRLGPIMVQLPPSFGPDRLQVLERFLASLPSAFHFAVEVRHITFYTDAELSRRLDALLAHFACERVLMDTVAMRSGDPHHPDVKAALHKKPNLPITPTAVGRHPIVRFVSHPQEPVNLPHLETWLQVLIDWIREGREPYFFVHCPNDFYSPPLARRLHRELSQDVEVGTMPTWPGEVVEEVKGQMSLF